VLLFMVIWFTFSYLPIAHMVWFWMGPDAYTGKEVVDAMNAKAGLIWQWGALDFAGGTVVHINAAVAGLVGAYMVGKRIGYGKRSHGAAQPDADHGGRLAAVGGLVRLQRRLRSEANGFAALAFMNTFGAPLPPCWPGVSVKR
jgi:Amt family ammonium transporter